MDERFYAAVVRNYGQASFAKVYGRRLMWSIQLVRRELTYECERSSYIEKRSAMPLHEHAGRGPAWRGTISSLLQHLGS